MFPFNLWKKKPADAPLTPEQDAFLASCTQEYNEKLEILNRDWGFSDYKNWGFDQASGLFFLDLNDDSRVEADGQIIGSYMPSKKSWEWSWNNPHVLDSMKRDAQLVRAWGEKERINYLSTGMIPVPDKLSPSYLASIATKVVGAQGAFAGAAGSVQVFFTLKNLRRVK